MEKERKIYIAKRDYQEIQGSRVSWRKKSSYRKPIKRRANKLRRLVMRISENDFE